MIRSRSFLLVAALLGAPLVAQGEKLSYAGPSPGTVQLGGESRIELVVEGEHADPRTPELPEVPFLILQVSAPSKHHSSFFNGRTMTVRNEVRFTVTVRPQREGEFQIPPIRVNTGSRVQQTPELRLDCVKDMRGQDLGFLDVRIEPQRVYVHEPIRVAVEFGVDSGLKLAQDVYQRYRYLDVEVQAPWLTEFEGAVSLPTPEPADPRLVVLNRSLLQADYTANHERGGKTYNRFVIEKSFLPSKTGVFELPAPLLRYHVVHREGRGRFLEPVRRETENYYVYGEPVTLEVLPIPEAGRPVPYYGAVGRFAVRAELDKNEVKVGNSVKLTLTISGQGNLEFLRVPDLDELQGFHKLGQAEERDQQTVRVIYDLTPLEVSVEQVPPVAWNYFDTTPGVEKFVSVSTAPLPLRVRPLENGETLVALPGEETASIVPGVDDIFDMKPLGAGAPERLPQRLPTWVVAVAVALPWLLVLGATLLWTSMRRRAADLIGQRARGAERSFNKALAAGVDPAEALAGYLGDRLGVPAAALIGPDLGQRLAAAAIDEALAGEVREAIERGVAARYGGGDGLTADRAKELVSRLERGEVRRAGGAAVPLLILALAATAGTGGAQDTAAERAYRAGDYGAAAEAFAAAASGPDVDRRVYYNLGNARFRQGQWAQALWAYERARLAMPRDAELFANIALVRGKLELDTGSGEPFLEALQKLRDRLTGGELLALCALFHLVAAGLLVWGRRRPALRWLGVAAAVPALLLTLELAWWGPARPPRGIVLQPAAIVAEPREGLEPVLKVRPGVELAVLGSGERWTMVEVQGRRGYLRSAAVGVVD